MRNIISVNVIKQRYKKFKEELPKFFDNGERSKAGNT